VFLCWLTTYDLKIGGIDTTAAMNKQGKEYQHEHPDHSEHSTHIKRHLIIRRRGLTHLLDRHLFRIFLLGDTSLRQCAQYQIPQLTGHRQGKRGGTSTAAQILSRSGSTFYVFLLQGQDKTPRTRGPNVTGNHSLIQCPRLMIGFAKFLLTNPSGVYHQRTMEQVKASIG
jgi:hypothetical protein